MVTTPYFFDILKELFNSFQTCGNGFSETINDSVDTDETVIAQILNQNH